MSWAANTYEQITDLLIETRTPQGVFGHLRLLEGRDIFIDSYKNPSTKQELFLIRERTIERSFSENTSINRLVISPAILQCLNLT